MDWFDEASQPTVTEVTRRAIMDALRLEDVSWAGSLEEADFLSRIFDLSKMPSHDGRFRDAAGDIWQHRVRNFDWPGDWVFSDRRFNLLRGPDEQFLRFLTEMLHPVVRPDAEAVEALRSMFNQHLRADGWEIFPSQHISGRPVFAARRMNPARNRAVDALKEVATALGTADYIAQQITRIEAAVESDPALAIGTAKELVETVCKSILAARGETSYDAWDVPRLAKETAKRLDLTPEDVDDAAEGAAATRRILGALASIAGGLAELRNLYGTGHGKTADAKGLEARHAHLAVGAATTLVMFFHQTHLARPSE